LSQTAGTTPGPNYHHIASRWDVYTFSGHNSTLAGHRPSSSPGHGPKPLFYLSYLSVYLYQRYLFQNLSQILLPQ